MIRTEIETAPDADNPNRSIRRQRVFDPLRRLLAKGVITHAHWVAAERFRDCVALAAGARSGAGGRLEAWQRCHYSARVADARQEARGSLHAVGPRLSPVFTGAVLHQMPMREIERLGNLRRDSAPGMIVEALDRLAAYQANTS
jgi:hypothetical protein